MAGRHARGLDQGHKSPVRAVAAYRSAAATKTAIERQADAGRKTGVFTGHVAINPVNGEYIPVFTADYVLMGYGTGAIMAVPAHDQRDWDFARDFELPVVRVVDGPGDIAEAAYVGDGVAVNSSHADLSLDGLSVSDAKRTITAWLEKHGIGRGTVTYRLRDWLFSRQRYWGEPFPIVYDEHDLPIAAARRAAARRAARGAGLLAAHLRRRRRALRAGAAAGPQRGVGERHPGPGRRPEGLPTRHEHDAQLGRVVLVLPALPRPGRARHGGRP